MKKMNKEDAKKQIAERLELASKIDDPLAGGQKSAFGDNLLAIVDAIEVEHKPVFLPQKVGKQWTKLVSHYWSSQSADDIWSGTNYALGRLRALGELDRDYGELVNWWANTKDSYTQLVDAARYGWVSEPETLFVLPLDGTGDDLMSLYAIKDTQGDWDMRPANDDRCAVLNHYTVGQSDIDSAPAWVKAIKPVEARYDRISAKCV
jgi:hypothetical protein